MKDGGAAFPSPGVVLGNAQQQGAYEGMTLRDYFAGQVAVGLITFANGERLEKLFGASDAPTPHAFFAGVAYALADAMIAERAKASP